MNYSAPLRRVSFAGATASSTLALACCFVSTIFLIVQSPILLYVGLIAALVYRRYPQIVMHPWVQRLGGMRTIGLLGGTLVFAAIAFHGDPAHAQLFKNAEQQTNGIFGSYIDPSIVKFMFGLLRVVGRPTHPKADREWVRVKNKFVGVVVLESKPPGFVSPEHQLYYLWQVISQFPDCEFVCELGAADRTMARMTLQRLIPNQLEIGTDRAFMMNGY
jgi:hypothetical protein